MLSFMSRNGNVSMSIEARTSLHEAYDELRAEDVIRKAKAKKAERLQKRAVIEGRFTINSLRKPWPETDYEPLVYNTSLPSPFETPGSLRTNRT
jgi:hypothetical protein